MNPGTFLILCLATAGVSIATVAIHNRLRLFLYRDPVPAEAYDRIGLYMGIQSLAVGVLIGLCVSIPVIEYLWP